MNAVPQGRPGAAAALSAEEIRRRAEALGPWFHNLDLGGVRTASGSAGVV